MPDVACGGCGSVVPDRLTVCPSCLGLVHRARLEAIAAEAKQRAAIGDFESEARSWRDALPLLPPGSKQYEAVLAHLDGATAKMQRPPETAHPNASRRAGVLASAGALLVALLTKGKLLLLGLTKLGTLLSMLAFVVVYWRAWGFAFAAAFVATIYIHEMGHVAALKARGIAAHAPMFIPGLGAFVRMNDRPSTPAEDARIGLAGPLWGLGAVILAASISLVTNPPFWRAVAHSAAVINLFNLTPVWQLDGSRGFAAFPRLQRWLVVALIGVAWALSREGMLIVVAIVAIWRSFEKRLPPASDWGAFARYALLLGALSAFTMLRQ